MYGIDYFGKLHSHYPGYNFETLSVCGSGKEVAEMGSIEDIRLAADLDTSTAAPLLVEGAYQSPH